MITPVSLSFVNKTNSVFKLQQNATMPAFRGSNNDSSGDTFVRSTEELKKAVKPRERKILDSPENEFIKWAEETGFMETGLREALQPENFIGEGFHHAAYKIPNNEDYVLRVQRDFRCKDGEIDYSRYIIKDTRDKELTRNCGQQIALLVDKNPDISGYSPNIEVLLKQKGYANSNPSPRALLLREDSDELRPGVLSYDDNSRKSYFAHCMKALAQLPDESYDILIEDIIVAGEAGYRFDHFNSNNFLIDEEDEKINIIDMETAPKPHKDRFGNTLYALVNAEFFRTYFSSYSDYVPEYEGEKEDTLKNIITVLDKYTRALQRNHQKYNRTSYEFFMELIPSMPVSFWLRTMDLNEKFKKLSEMDVLYDPENPGTYGSVKMK